MTSRKKAGANCCVVGCKNNTLNSQSTRFYVFSRVYYKRAQTEKWIAAVGRKNPDGTPWEPKKYSRICSHHFIGNKKSDHPFSPSFVPTIFPKNHENSGKFKNSTKTAATRFELIKAKPLNIPQSSSERLIQNPRDIQSQNNSKNNRKVLQKNQQTQVDFSETATDCSVFVCNRYVDSKTCQAEIQTSIRRIEESSEKTIEKEMNVHSEAECSYQDIAVGLDSVSLCKNLPLKRDASFRGFSSITNDREIMNLGGVTLDNFHLLVKILEGSSNLKISQTDQLLIFLTKMKLGLTFSALSVLYNTKKITIYRTFYRTLKYLSGVCKKFVEWPNRESAQSMTPNALKKTLRNCRVIINCTEIEVEKPRVAKQRAELYSDEKKKFIVKFLVGCAPNGLISFVSKYHNGRTRDVRVISSSGFLDLLEPNDIVLSVNGTPEIKTTVTNSGKEIRLVIPRNYRNNSFSNEEKRDSDAAASARFSTALTLQRLRSYKILSKVMVNMLPYLDDIFFMCCVLVNLQKKHNEERN